MAFSLKREAEDWFTHIRDKPPFKTKFDLYYLCLMVGLTMGRRSKVSAQEFVDNFVEDYKAAQTLIIGSLVLAELKRMQVSLEDKQDVQKLMKDLIDPSSSTNLTSEGMRLLNEYASGGYDSLAEHRDVKPYSAAEFFRDYVGLIDEALEKEPFATNLMGSGH